MSKRLLHTLGAELTVRARVFAWLYFVQEAHGRIRVTSSLHPHSQLRIRKTAHCLEDWAAILNILQEAAREAGLLELGCCKFRVFHCASDEFLVSHTVSRERSILLLQVGSRPELQVAQLTGVRPPDFFT
jgi:hypothetical protein